MIKYKKKKKEWKGSIARELFFEGMMFSHRPQEIKSPPNNKGSGILDNSLEGKTWKILGTRIRTDK
jgi:hypothetical protein